MSILTLYNRYYHWLHGKWPVAKVEALPVIDENFCTRIPGVYIVGDLTGVPLLKFALDSGAKVVQHIYQRKEKPSEDCPLVIIGGGVSGYAAALQAKQYGIDCMLVEAKTPFSTLENFPKEKPIFTYPSNFDPAGVLQLSEDVNNKENLLACLKQQINEANIPVKSLEATHIEKKSGELYVFFDDDSCLKASAIIIAIGRAGKFRALDVPGEQLDKVVNRLHDPKVYANKQLLVVGGGDSALEAAIACAKAGASVTLSYRQAQFSRPKPANLSALQSEVDRGAIQLLMQSDVLAINEHTVDIRRHDKGITTIDNDQVLTLIGREAPLDFFRRSQLPIQGQSSWSGWLFFIAFVMAMAGLYDWKNYGFLNALWSQTAFPDQVPSVFTSVGQWWQIQVEDRSTLIGTLAVSMKSRSFYYTLLYTSCIGYFGWLRIRRRKTTYVTVQTLTLFLVQLLPLFLIPEILLPFMGYNGLFDTGWLQSVANELFPSYISQADLLAHNWPDWGHPRAYWHAYGLILAWPLNVYNVFTPNPMTGWLIISAVQTFIIIPALIYRYGKGAYCGWICSCGALAETMGDGQRHKMPRGSAWNKLNMIGQWLLLIAVVLLLVRIGGWLFPESWMHRSFDLLLKGENSDYKLVNPLSWKWTVDVLIGGIIGVGFYFKFSGRVWCRFACPLAALMHIYSRFSRFRIFSNKDKCISCNSCTSVCHQGIDVMNFANRGEPMQDPQCVRCSACVQVCPTGVLSFGRLYSSTAGVKYDSLSASSVQIQEPSQRINVINV